MAVTAYHAAEQQPQPQPVAECLNAIRRTAYRSRDGRTYVRPYLVHKQLEQDVAAIPDIPGTAGQLLKVLDLAAPTGSTRMSQYALAVRMTKRGKPMSTRQIRRLELKLVAAGRLLIIPDPTHGRRQRRGQNLNTYVVIPADHAAAKAALDHDRAVMKANAHERAVYAQGKRRQRAKAHRRLLDNIEAAARHAAHRQAYADVIGLYQLNQGLRPSPPDIFVMQDKCQAFFPPLLDDPSAAAGGKPPKPRPKMPFI